MARASEINIDIYGKESHAAKYKEGIDALEIGAEILLEIYAMEKKSQMNIIAYFALEEWKVVLYET